MAQLWPSSREKVGVFRISQRLSRKTFRKEYLCALMCPREPATEKNPNLIKEKAEKKKKKKEERDPLWYNKPLTTGSQNP